jgi:hypothetical protein
VCKFEPGMSAYMVRSYLNWTSDTKLKSSSSPHDRDYQHSPILPFSGVETRIAMGSVVRVGDPPLEGGGISII